MDVKMIPRCSSCRVPLTKPERAGLVRICTACKTLYRREYQRDLDRFMADSQAVAR